MFGLVIFSNSCAMTTSPFALSAGRGVVLQILFERHQGIRQATVCDLAGFDQRHEAVAGAPFAVARGAKTRNVAEAEQPIDDLVERPPIADVELSGILFRRFFVNIAADAGA